MKLPLKICALCMAVCLGVSPQGFAQVSESSQRPSRASRKAAQRPLKNVTYSFVAGKKLKLDLYYPAQRSLGPFPVVIYLHAGAWMGGNKGGKEIKHYLPYMLERGYAVASIEYRLAPKSKFPAQVEDSKCAVRFIRENGPSFMLDPARIGVLGASAGGHLGALMSVAQPSDGFEGTGGWPQQSSRVQAAVSLFGITDLPPLAKDPRNFEIIEKVFGVGQLERASPIDYINPGDSPCMLVHGILDSRVPPSQSQLMYDMLVQAGVPADLLMVEHAGHAMVPVGGIPNPSFNAQMSLILDFLDQHVKNAPADSPLDRTLTE